MTKLTKRTVDALSSQPKDYLVFDEEVKGFGVRVLPTGQKTYLAQYRSGGRTRRVKIGRHGVLTAEQARAKAKELLGAVAKGDNPARDIDEHRRAPTVATLCERFYRDHVMERCKPTTQREYRRSIDLFIKPAIGPFKIVDVTRADIAQLHHDLRDRPYQANRTLGVLSKMFNLAEVWGLLPDGSNPCRHVTKYTERRRETFLSEKELARLAQVLTDGHADGSPKRDWTVSVRYTSAGLWEHGVVALRERVFNALRPYTAMRQPDCIRVTRADWCFDFYSPDFTKEFGPGLVAQTVCHSSTKSREKGSYDVHGRAGIGETLTIGTKAGLEVQVYDKVREITEQSGKTWLYDLWAQNLGDTPWGNGKPNDMWRLECRFSKVFLKQRNTRRPHELEAARDKLIAEALATRRLTAANTTDTNHSRWRLHPLWSAAYRLRKVEEMVPLGRKVTGRRDALIARGRQQIAGSIRSLSILENGTYDEAKAQELATEALSTITKDPKHLAKITAAQDRYSDVEDAR